MPFFRSKQQYPQFKLAFNRTFRSLPSMDNKEKINIRYPLIIPYATAHIYWDNNRDELVYDVEEPALNDNLKKVLKISQKSLAELIDINKKPKNMPLVEFLELQFREILRLFKFKLTEGEYLTVMYYLFRDFLGFNEIDPLMHDIYIEDIECNGVGFPVYIVHRLYENLRTNIVFETHDKLRDFVEKLALKAGKYVSYAQPLLDGALPDGSRVNATFSDDVTTRGPTFTIRKFNEDPLTPVYLMKNKTLNAKGFAYLWMAIEHKFNIMIIGETASGKTTLLNSLMHFVPSQARICSIEDTREINLPHSNWLPAVSRSGFSHENLFGKEFGEISLFDLLKETFRQNPDYVIIGEARGDEVYVMFQGMASGHPTFSTFHAENVNMLLRRLENKPINLPGSLIETLDIIISINHFKTHEKNIRRVQEIDEMIRVENNGHADFHAFLKYDPATDSFIMDKNSILLKKMSEKTGLSVDKLMNELEKREQILIKFMENEVVNYKEFNELVNLYYADPQKVMERLNGR